MAVGQLSEAVAARHVGLGAPIVHPAVTSERKQARKPDADENDGDEAFGSRGAEDIDDDLKHRLRDRAVERAVKVLHAEQEGENVKEAKL
jgi:hypothetical protein